MNLRNMTTLGTRLLAAVLCLNAFLARPAQAQDEYFPIGEMRDWNANSSNCAMEVSNHFESTCGLYSFAPLQQEGTNDPLFCNSECEKCCDSFDQTTGGDIFLVDSTCRCAQSFVLTGGVGIIGCVVPTTINAAFAAGLIDEETRLILLEVQQMAALGKLGDDILKNSPLYGQGVLIDRLRDRFAEAQQEYLERIARGVVGLTRLGVMLTNLCGYVEEEYEEFAVESCKNACQRWFPEPPLPEPEPEPEPEGPVMSGHVGIEPQIQVVPDPPEGSGGGAGWPDGPGGATWIEEFGPMVEPPLL